MSKSVSEDYLARVLSFGIFFTTIFVLSGSVTDPVNVTKLICLGVVGSIAFGILAASGIHKLISKSRVAWITSLLFIISSLNSVINSNAPVSQSFYGSYGRNNGFLTYLFLVFIFLSVSSLSDSNSIKLILRSLIWAGIVNIFYCTWVLIFGDFIGWNNPYGNVLGTFGNPNFVGSFLGIFFAGYLAYGISSSSSKLFKYSMFIVIPSTIFSIYQSHAIQGRVVALSGSAIVFYFYIRARMKMRFVLVYLGAILFIGVLAIFGALQTGPLANLIYKTSVSLRGQYWLAGWKTGNSHPFTGVGMDAFGDWYRRSRDMHALEMPGVNTVVNASHNVPLDMFAFGGWPLFITYLLLMGIGAFSIIRMVISTRHFDPLLVIVVTTWVGYQIQSIISINQIGLAIWGWAINGAAIAYAKISSKSPIDLTRLNLKKANKVLSKKNNFIGLNTIISSSIFGCIGLILALPPLSADAKWRKAQSVRTVQSLEESMKSTYFNPANTMKYSINIQTLEQNNLSALARDYALKAVKWNPDAFELWRALYFVRAATPADKVVAIKNMKRLDPLNPDVTNIK